MDLRTQLRSIEKKVAGRMLDSKVHFFDNETEFDKSSKCSLIGENDICFIDDILK